MPAHCYVSYVNVICDGFVQVHYILADEVQRLSGLIACFLSEEFNVIEDAPDETLKTKNVRLAVTSLSCSLSFNIQKGRFPNNQETGLEGQLEGRIKLLKSCNYFSV